MADTDDDLSSITIELVNLQLIFFELRSMSQGLHVNSTISLKGILRRIYLRVP